MSGIASRQTRFSAWWSHAFAVETSEDGFDAEDEALAERLARFVVRRRMTAPALLVLETGRPFNFIGSQFLVFLYPFVTLIFSAAEFERFIRFLEKRPSIEFLVDKILELEHERDE